MPSVTFHQDDYETFLAEIAHAAAMPMASAAPRLARRLRLLCQDAVPEFEETRQPGDHTPASLRLSHWPLSAGAPADEVERLIEGAKDNRYGHRDALMVLRAFRCASGLSTIRLWMNIYPEFSPAIRVEKAAANQRVEFSLYQRGIGCNYEATKIFMPAGSKQPVIVHYLEHVPADVGAAFIWLKNRDPDHWRDIQNVEHVLGKYLISDKPMTLEEWASARATVVDGVIDDSSPDLPKLPKSSDKPTKP
jgi:hypothetical protein